MRVLHLPRMFLKDCVTTFKKKAESKEKEECLWKTGMSKQIKFDRKGSERNKKV